MAKFVENYVNYIDEKRYKRNFIAKKSSMEPNKLSRILTGKQPITEDEMCALAKVVGRKVSFFLDDYRGWQVEESCAYYSMESSAEVRMFAEELRNFADAIDVVLGAANRIEISARSNEEWI